MFLKLTTKEEKPNILDWHTLCTRWPEFSTAFGFANTDPIGCFIANTGEPFGINKSFQKYQANGI